MLLKELTQCFGVSGYEEKIAQLIMDNIKDKVDEVMIDSMGTIIALKKGNGENKKKIMIASHMDEIGFSVLNITDKGYVKVRNLGGISAHVSYMNRIKFRNGVTGIISSIEKSENLKNNEINKLYVDIGANSKEDALKYVNIGEPACYVGEFQELKNSCVTAKAIDNRIGCYILIESLKKLKDSYNDVYFVFTVQEEVGLRGATASSKRIKPDIGIAVDITGSFDVPFETDGNAIIGNGAAIKVMDSSVICDDYLVKEMIKCSEEKNIKYQLDVLLGGGTDAGAINTSNYGVKCCGISIPTRYGHGPNAVISMEDTNACIELLKEYINREFKF